MKRYELIGILALALLLGGGCGNDSHTRDHDHANCDHEIEAAQAAPCGADHKHAEAACGQDQDHGHEHDGEACAEEHACEGTAIEVPANAQRLLGVTFATAAQRRVTGTVRFPGRFEWMPGARRIYGAAISGSVELCARPPQKVSVGDPLFTLRSPEWEAKRGLAREAEAALALVQAETEALRQRLARLHDTGARNADLEQQLATREAEEERAESARQNAVEALQTVLSFCRESDGLLVFEAREAGFIETLAVENGAWVAAGAEIARVAREDGLWFRADGVLSEMTPVRTGQQGFVEPLGRLQADAAYGKIELGLAADDTARTQPVYLALPAPVPWALPGSAGVLSVVTTESVPESVALPLACVVADGLRSIVFVRDEQDPERFFARTVELGTSDGDWVEVAGVESGSTVVLDGAQELKLALPAQGALQRAVGHFHADGQFHEGEH
ncbi:MAG: efflux RND transporter periplasmic adaptor subunit [Kiritimatiellae bacterium]|nr:efflux RND transporter periplasmic adaptor subunit [Kiritimatiellia bacterium]